MAMVNFADRLTVAIRSLRSPVCVGIDPVLGKLPRHILDEARNRHGETERGAGAALHAFGCGIVDAVAGHVPAVKPQIAFFEAYGPAGYEAFWSVVDYARSRNLLVVADAKRGDIGSTAEAYADAFFGHLAPAQTWSTADRFADALTVNAYLGSDALEPLVKRAAQKGGGLFILVKTSNPGARELQDQPLLSEESVAVQVAKLVNSLGERLVGESGLSSVGAVVGATYPEDLADLRGWMPSAYFLVPGYGAQGGTAAAAAHAFRPDGLGALISASRSVIYAAPPAAGAQEFRQAVAAAAQQMNTELRTALAQAGKAL